MKAEVFNSPVIDQNIKLLSRPIDGQVHFSDVVSDDARPASRFPLVHFWRGGEWRQGDFDSELTIDARSHGFHGRPVKIPNGVRTWRTQHGLVLTDDLARERIGYIESSEAEESLWHPDTQREIAASQGAVIALANKALRDKANTLNGANGSDFYLAITDAATEIYVTPLSFLSSLEARNRITSLFRIPTKGHPEFDGDHEQFRSARVIRSRRHPDHLVPIYQYKDREELLYYKAKGTHPNVIPTDVGKNHIAYIDKFGNVKIDVDSTDGLDQISDGGSASLLLTNRGKQYAVDVIKSADLISSPIGKLAIYGNGSDFSDPNSERHYLELAVRVDDDPTTSRNTAAFQIQRLIRRHQPLRGWDIANTKVELRA
jgi:hypothetical protein